MDMLLPALSALLLLAAAAYVQSQVPAYTRGGTRIALTRGLLAVVGIGFGLTCAAYVSGRLPQILAFAIGFGLVHMPAAIILFIKGRRGEGKS